jgi:tetratricopeptide (TPR) repeat protein
MNGVAELLSAQGQWPEAEIIFREGLEITRRLLTERHPSYLWMLNGLVQVLLTQKKYDQAEEYARRNLDIEIKVLGPDHPLVASSLTELARVLESKGNSLEAKTNLDRALGIWCKRLNNQDPNMGETVNALFEMLLPKRDFAEAKRIYDVVTTPQAVDDPPNKTLLWVCGNYLARTGQFKAAVEKIQKVIELDPDDHQAYQSLAALYVQLGDVQAYEQLRGQILTTFGSLTSDPRIADRMAKSCLILPPDPRDLAVVTNLAQIAVSFDKNAAANPWFQFCKGFAEYRAGNFSSAKNWMKTVLKPANNGSRRDIEAYMVLAMSEQCLNEPEAAQKDFADGVKLSAKRLNSLSSGDIDLGWTDWILGHALMREAERKIMHGPDPEPLILPASQPVP